MSVERLAQIVGATSIQIEKYEAGTERVNAAELLRIAVALDQNVAFFFEDARVVRAAGQSHTPRMLSEEAIELLQAFANVRGPLARRTIIELTISMASPK
jgi:transcriptional regulator with XRE-family HTH domain